MRILLIRLRLIGDVIFTTPALRALRRHLPDAHLSYLVESEAAPVLGGNPHVTEVCIARRSRGVRRLRDDLALGRRLRGARFDAVIDFHGGPRSSWLAWVTGAPIRIGYDVPYRGWAYTERIPRSRQLRPRHSVENQWDLLAPFGGALAAPPDRRRDPVEMVEDDEAAQRVDERLDKAGIRSEDPLIVIHVSAGNPFRRWPSESFVPLIAGLADVDARRRFFITSGPSESDVAERIRSAARARLGQRADVVIKSEEYGLAELRSLLSRAALFIGGDSGPLHVAATTRVPIVGLYGPTMPERSAPWRDPALASEAVDVGPLPCRPCEQRRCLPGDFRCLTTIEPAAVRAAAERALERSACPTRH